MGIKIGFLWMLTIVFIILKLVGTIDWSWWLVFAPIWIPALILLLGVLIAIGLAIMIFSLIFLVIAILTPILGKQWSKSNIIKIKTRMKE